MRGEITAGFPVRRPRYAGIGLVTGTFITGMSVKVMATREHAAQLTAGLAWSPFTYWPRAGFGVGIDYLYHLPTLFDASPVYLGWHLGLGASVRVRPDLEQSSVAITLNAVLGAEILFRHAPIDVTIAWRPGAIFGTGQSRGLAFAYGDIGVHVRFWFDTRDVAVSD